MMDQHTSTNRAGANRVVSDDMSFGWMHENNYIESTPRDESRAYKEFKDYALASGN